MQRKLNRKKLGISILTFALFIGAFYGVQFLISKLPTVSQVDLIGLETLDRHQVMAIAKFEDPTPIFGSRLRRALDRISKHPAIASVAVRRSWSGKVSITIDERNPKAVLILESPYYIDNYGVVFRAVSGSAPQGLPIISGLQDDGVSSKEALAPILRESLALIDALHQTTWLQPSDIKELHIDAATGFTISSRSMQGPIYLGMPPFEKNLNRLKMIETRFAKQLHKIASIDLDYESKAFIRFVDSKGLTLAMKGR